MARRRKIKWPHKHERETWKGWKAPFCVEINESICAIRTVHMHGENNEDAPEHLAGFIFCHDAADLEWRCEGVVNVDPHLLRDGHPIWSITGTLEDGDLTLAPSILCTRDQFHGFIQNGKWVPA